MCCSRVSELVCAARLTEFAGHVAAERNSGQMSATLCADASRFAEVRARKLRLQALLFNVWLEAAKDSTDILRSVFVESILSNLAAVMKNCGDFDAKYPAGLSHSLVR